MDEIAQNRLSQDEMSEGDPARIVGQAVESEVFKRKREEATLSELDLHLCEKSFALEAGGLNQCNIAWRCLSR